MNALAPPAPPGSAESQAAGELADDLGRLLKLLYVLRDRTPRVLPDVETGAQPLIHRLARCGSCRVSDLAAGLHADVSTVSRHATSLAHAGLIEKTTAPGDRRVQVLALTESGREALASLRQQRAESFARILGGWEPTEVAAFRGFINRFAEDLERDLGQQSQAAGASQQHESRPGVRQ